MRYPTWNGLPIIAKTTKAEEEMNELDIYFIQLEDLLKRSFHVQEVEEREVYMNNVFM